MSKKHPTTYLSLKYHLPIAGCCERVDSRDWQPRHLHANTGYRCYYWSKCCIVIIIWFLNLGEGSTMESVDGQSCGQSVCCWNVESKSHTKVFKFYKWNLLHMILYSEDVHDIVLKSHLSIYPYFLWQSGDSGVYFRALL